ncbi:MAG: SpaH/EbpB family LPXTG-anchored major pilin [Clostridia bacterium]|nr:SpaH/EbpB family LPXTG-anchored major pilin [Clostridia bacterium]
MKKAKTLLSVILAVMLVFTMALTSFAAGEGSITIANAVSGQTYSVYKMFSLVPSSVGGESYLYEAEDAWVAFLSGDGADYVEVDGDTIIWVGAENDGVADADAVAEFAKLALDYAEDNNITATESKSASSSTVEFTGLDLGYYLVDSSLGALCGLTSTNPTATVSEKNDQPKVEKTVLEDSTGEYGSANTATIGDTVSYKTVITAQEGAENYVLHDKMESGLTFDATSVVVTNGTTTLTSGTDYTLSTSCADGCTFEIDFSDAFEATLGANEEIVVTYTATLNANAEISTSTNDNETHLNYGDSNRTNSSITTTETFKFDLVKTDENNTIITGAQFKFYADEDCTDEIKLVLVSEGVYRPALADETAVDVIEAGTVTIVGLDSDVQSTYYLKETQAPEGYNLLTSPVTVSLTDDNDNAANLVAEIADDKYVQGGVQVINDSGSILPSTGGIGTVIFYVIGGLLVAGAVVLLITKKKMSAETK